MITVPFDELAIGDELRSRGRTITETDVVNFCAFTGNWLEIHSNEEFARQTEYGHRLVQGSLAFAVIAGLFEWSPRVIVAFYGVDRLRFLRPVRIGDTLTAVRKVIEKRERDEQTGVVALEVGLFNQRDELVQSSVFKLVVRRRPLSAAARDRA